MRLDDKSCSGDFCTADQALVDRAIDLFANIPHGSETKEDFLEMNRKIGMIK